MRDEDRKRVEEIRAAREADTLIFWEDRVDELLEIIDRMRVAYEAVEGREKLWKEQAGRDQTENRVLKAQLTGSHVTHPGTTEGDYSVPQLVQFMREAANHAKEGKWGMWRAKEFSAVADALQVMYDSYLVECPHEAAVSSLRERVATREDVELVEQAILLVHNTHGLGTSEREGWALDAARASLRAMGKEVVE